MPTLRSESESNSTGEFESIDLQVQPVAVKDRTGATVISDFAEDTEIRLGQILKAATRRVAVRYAIHFSQEYPDPPVFMGVELDIDSGTDEKIRRDRPEGHARPKQ